MNWYKDCSKLKRILKVIGIRESMESLYKSNSIVNRYLGLYFGLYLADKITYSSYRRLEVLINKVREKQIISLR